MYTVLYYCALIDWRNLSFYGEMNIDRISEKKKICLLVDFSNLKTKSE